MHKTRHLSKRTHGKQCEFFQLYFHVQINNQMPRGVGGNGEANFKCSFVLLRNILMNGSKLWSA